MKIVFLPRAEQELADAVDFYEQQLDGLGALFSKEVFEIINLIAVYPEAWQQITKRSRKCPLRRFPYMVLYGIVDEAIVISSIAHQHRHPHFYLN